MRASRARGRRAADTLPWAIIPVAGLGKRLDPATAVVPKALLPVGPLPMLHWTLVEALDAGFRKVALIAGPEQEVVRRYVELAADRARRGDAGALARLGARLGQCRLHWIEQPRPRGLGEALARCEEVTRDRCFVVLLPDNWFASSRPAIGQVFAGLESTGTPALGLTLVDAADAGLYGNVGRVRLEALGDETYRILELQDKGEGAFEASTAGSELRGCGRYALTPEFYDALRATAPAGTTRPGSLAEPGSVGADAGEGRRGGRRAEWDDVPAFQWLIARDRLVGRRIRGRHFDVGQRVGYAAANVYAHSSER